MVNFKGGGHQGEHKRALAAQGSDASAVTKLEKLALRRDDAQRTVVNEDALALRVVAREKRLGETNSLLKAALVDEDALAHFQQRAAASKHGTNALGAPLLCRPGGDFVLAARVHPLAAPGEVLLSEAQRLTLHVCEDDWYEWTPFDAECEPLAELVLEAQLMQPTPDGKPLRIEADELARAAAKWLFGEVVSSNEIFMASYCPPTATANGANGTGSGEQRRSAAGVDADADATAESKRVRALRKKLRQIHDAKAAHGGGGGGTIPAEQLAKLEQEGAVRAELEAMGVDPDVEPPPKQHVANGHGGVANGKAANGHGGGTNGVANGGGANGHGCNSRGDGGGDGDGGCGGGGGVRLVLRVTDVALPPTTDDDADAAAAAAVSGPHCFRGVLSAAQTRVYVQPSTNYKSSALQVMMPPSLLLRSSNPLTFVAPIRADRAPVRTAAPTRRAAADCKHANSAAEAAAQGGPRHDVRRRDVPLPEAAAQAVHRPHQGGASSLHDPTLTARYHPLTTAQPCFRPP